jgi:2-dehydro-3-deoxyphosphogluconate aldolase/(4S)-4-hydroxy-2-oxoglutarate aldolase
MTHNTKKPQCTSIAVFLCYTYIKKELVYMNPIYQQLAEMRIVPVIVINDAAKAVPLARALVAGGLPCAEITFRTAAAADAIRAMTSEFPQMLVGAGTVLSAQNADDAVAAGAKFLVSPGLNPETVQYAKKIGVPMLPGVCTPSEVELALSLGLTELKFFPAEAAGGLKMLTAMAAPYSNVKFMPTGGLSPTNVGDYLKTKCIFACGGSWMVTAELINNDKWDEIERLTREAVVLARSL